jgi:Nickel/cobalt transporter regulator
MKNIILATLAAATVLTPIAAQAATTAPATARTAFSNNDASFQRGEGRWGEGNRGEDRRGGGEGGRGGGEDRQQRAQAPAPQQQQAPRNAQRNWSQERVRGEGQRDEVRRQGRPDAQQDGRYYDRNRDGNLDRRWDRNRDGNLDRNWDRNRDGRLDRRYDRNNDERIDRRYDRNRNGDIDRRYDRNNDNRVDRWSNNWRNDRRYDWRGHRERYGNHYRHGRYYSPYRGRSYSRIGIGFSLGSGYYGSRYWISDPWAYRLPPAYGPYRWVRYYDDVLLVDLRNGRVVDVIRDFFW